MMKKIALALVAAGALMAATAPAHANGRVSLSIGLGVPIGGYVGYAPPPVYYAPPPVYYDPPPVVYVPRPRYYAPPVVYSPPPAYYGAQVGGNGAGVPGMAAGMATRDGAAVAIGMTTTIEDRDASSHA